MVASQIGKLHRPVRCDTSLNRGIVEVKLI